MKTPIIPIEKADEKTVNALIKAGYLYVDNNGIHANENIPTQTSKSEQGYKTTQKCYFVFIVTQKKGKTQYESN